MLRQKVFNVYHETAIQTGWHIRNQKYGSAHKWSKKVHPNNINSEDVFLEHRVEASYPFPEGKGEENSLQW
jgi:hypothetical protein